MNTISCIEPPPWKDPYITWAEQTEFSYLVEGFESGRAFGGMPVTDTSDLAFVAELRDDFRVSVKVACEALFSSADKRAAMRVLLGLKRQAIAGYRVVTFRLARKSLDFLLGVAPTLFSRLELSNPVGTPVTKALSGKFHTQPMEEGGAPSRPLLGVIDDACPFAHASWRGRIRALWEQGRTSPPLGARIPGLGFPARTGYGWEYLRDTQETNKSNTLTTPTMALSKWEAQFVGYAGRTDEAEAYRSADFRVLGRRLSHGAHALDLLAGMHSPAARFYAAGFERSTPPTSTRSVGEIVFVQLPRVATEDTSGRWLASHVLDGLRYIVRFAQPSQRVVVNLSYGHTTGPHDGSSLLELGIDDLCQMYDGTADKPHLLVVLPTGNSFRAQSHADHSIDQSHFVDLKWRVLPDGQRSSFMELWFSDDFEAAQDVTLSITSPSGGAPFTFALGSHHVPSAGLTVVFQRMNGAGGGIKKVMALIALAPTADVQGSLASSPPLAMAGDWTVRICNESSKVVQVNTYVARSTPHMNTRRRGTLSYLVDGLYDPQRYLRAADDDAGGASVRRRGTISGIGTGAYTHKVAGYIYSDGQHNEMSSAGPDRAGYVKVTCALPTDFSRALRGVLGAGNLGGTVSRLEGTSTAAPQLGRWLAAAPLITSVRASLPVPPVVIPLPPFSNSLVGMGDVPPP